MYAFAISLHLLAAIVWIGGMFFAYFCLRPSLPATLDPPQAARVMAASLARFFRWVWLSVVVLLVSGFYMLFAHYSLDAAPPWLYAMMAVGLTMTLLFAHVFFAPFQRLRLAIESGATVQVRAAIGQIRRIVAINLALGVIIVVTISLGRYL